MSANATLNHLYDAIEYATITEIIKVRSRRIMDFKDEKMNSPQTLNQ